MEEAAGSDASCHVVCLGPNCGRAWAPGGSPNHGPLHVVGEALCMAPGDRARTSPSPSRNVDASGNLMHVLHEQFMARWQPQSVGLTLPDTGDVHVYSLTPDEGAPAIAHVVYARTTCAELRAGPDAVRAAIDAVCRRVETRSEDSPGEDGAASQTNPAAGYYVATGSATRGQRKTATLPRGSRKVKEVQGRTAPYRHRNFADPEVQHVCELAAPLMGDAARVLQRHVGHVYGGMWEHTRANPLMGMALLYPSPGMQDGRCAHEFDVPHRGQPRGPSIPTQHLAFRVAGARDDASMQERIMAALGVSDHHMDLMDSDHDAPILFVPDISDAARARLHGHQLEHPLPSSDLVLAEGPCTSSRGDRAYRIVTCKDGWVCIVLTRYRRYMHGNVYPCGRHGVLVDREGVPYLARSRADMPPGVRLARLVCYCTTSLDSFAEAVQEAWNRCSTSSQRLALVQSILCALDAPLDARFLQCVVGEG